MTQEHEDQLREIYAAIALHGILSKYLGTSSQASATELGKVAVAVADAVISELKHKGAKNADVQS